MSAGEQRPHRERSLIATPLTVFTALIALTEAILTIGVINTSGGIQQVLTVFFVIFTPVIFGGFISILWKKPYVLYPPSEYGSQPTVETFVETIRRAEVVKVAQKIEARQDISEIVKSEFNSALNDLGVALSSAPPERSEQSWLVLEHAATLVLMGLNKADVHNPAVEKTFELFLKAADEIADVSPAAPFFARRLKVMLTALFELQAANRAQS